jgi:RNA polymerase sigma factor (TIGR02999 family)
MPTANRNASFEPEKDLTGIPNGGAQVDHQAGSELLPLVYAELHRLAVQKLRQEPPGQTLDPTALVHEAYLRVAGRNKGLRWDSRGHFFAAAAEAMRRILVENARRKAAKKHGGGLVRCDLEHIDLVAPEPREDLLALDEALSKLAATDKPSAELVQLQYFGGLTRVQAAAILGVSPRTADRLWAYARAWLRDALSGS